MLSGCKLAMHRQPAADCKPAKLQHKAALWGLPVHRLKCHLDHISKMTLESQGFHLLCVAAVHPGLFSKPFHETSLSHRRCPDFVRISFSGRLHSTPLSRYVFWSVADLALSVDGLYPLFTILTAARVELFLVFGCTFVMFCYFVVDTGELVCSPLCMLGHQPESQVRGGQGTRALPGQETSFISQPPCCPRYLYACAFLPRWMSLCLSV